MTNNDKKITSTTKTILFAGLIMTLMLPLTAINMADAIKDDGKSQMSVDELREKVKNTDRKSKEYFDLIKRGPLTDVETKQVKKIIKSDPELKNLFKSGSLELDSVSFVGDTSVIPVNWNAVIHTVQDGEVTTIQVDLDDDKIKKIKKDKVRKLALTNPLAVAQYDGTPSVGKAVRVTSETQPTDYTADASYDGFSALLLNAMAHNSDPDNEDICDSANSATTYWMQAGYIFTDVAWDIVFTDTELNCVPKHSGLPEPEIDHDIIFNIYAGSTWYGVIHNYSDYKFAYHVEPAPNSKFVGKDDGPATSVFMENGYTVSGWESQFNDTTLDMTDAEFVKTDSQSIDWSGEDQYHLNCNGNEVTEQVISGTLINDGTATWDVNEMADHISISHAQYMGYSGFPPNNGPAITLGGQSCPFEIDITEESIGKMTLLKSEFNDTDTIHVRVVDYDVNNCPTIIQKVTIDIFSDSNLKGTKLNLSETEANTGIFYGKFDISSENIVETTLKTTKKDSITAVYLDNTLPDSIPPKTWIGVVDVLSLGDNVKNSGTWIDQVRDLSPYNQWKLGVIPYYTQCGEGLDLVLKRHVGYPACVNPETTQKLYDRGWSSYLPKIVLQYSE